MKLGSNREIFSATVTAIICAVLIPACGPNATDQAPSVSPAGSGQGNVLRAEDAFQDIQLLRGLPVDEFMDTMGMFTAALLYDCTDCHGPDAVGNLEAFGRNTPMIQTTRRMIAMMNTINNSFFQGEPRVTCFTCHHGDFSPRSVPDLAIIYSPPVEDPNSMDIFLRDPQPPADPYFETYIQALGGAERLANLTGWTAVGTYAGYETGLEEVPLRVFARAPDKYSMIIEMLSGDSVRTYDGANGWIAGPERPVPLMELTGGNLFGARMDAIMSFPAGLRDEFSQWKVGAAVFEDGNVMTVIQGSSPGVDSPVNLYFDESTGLLWRLVRWNHTAVGIVPFQIEYEDYREVAGVRIPFRTIVTWTNGRSTIQFREVQPNVSIEDARFAQPDPAVRR